MRAAALTLGLLVLAAAAHAGVERPADLYAPVHTLGFEGDTVVARSNGATYRFAGDEWTVQRRGAADTVRHWPRGLAGYDDPMQPGIRYRFLFRVGADAVEFELRRYEGRDSSSAGSVRLYDRWQVARQRFGAWIRDNPGRTEAELARSVRLARPTIPSVVDDGRNLWLPIEFAGDGLGLVLRYDRARRALSVARPAEIGASSIARATVAAGMLWLAPRIYADGGVRATLGLVRYDPDRDEARVYDPDDSPLLGRLVTALAARGNELWMATDEGVCRLELREERWTCWRVAPVARTRSTLPAASRPGGEAARRLGAGAHRVRWMTEEMLLVDARDAVEGWVPFEQLKEWEADGFGQAAHRLARSDDRPEEIVLRAEPRERAAVAARLYRVPLERLPLRTADGWQRVRARAAWIPREKLEVLHRIDAVP